MSTDRLLLPSALPEWRRSGRFFLVALALHVAVLFYPLKIAIGKLDLPPPSTIMVRLVQAVSPPPSEPPRIQAAQPSQAQAPTTPRPSRERPAPTPRPILTMPAESTAAPAYALPAPVSAPPAPNSAPVANPAPAAVSTARFDAAYLHNPRPNYPPLSRRLGEEGKVLLKVRVSAEGTPLAVDLEKSSGFERLDEAAHQVVGRWRFVPAKRGDETIEASVIVPIAFRLDN